MPSSKLLKSILKQFEQAGTAQNRKVYARHGIGPAMFGVSFARGGFKILYLGGRHSRGAAATRDFRS